MIIANLHGLREIFNDDRLVYVPGEGRDWHQTTECLWASSTAIHGRVMLRDAYEDLQELFVEYLEVAQLNFELVYNELERLGQTPLSSPIDLVKENIWALNSFLESPDSVSDEKPLAMSRILPVRYPEGEVKLCNTETQFAIVDRVPLGEIFAHQIKTLDFHFGEIRRLDPFIRWMRIDKRFLSYLVKEISSVKGEKISAGTHTESIRTKAHALYR
jgi:hypothetical protein